MQQSDQVDEGEATTVHPRITRRVKRNRNRYCPVVALKVKEDHRLKKVAPAKSKKIAGRNERVSVQYTDGTIKKEVKFKHVEDDLRNNKCVIVED